MPDIVIRPLTAADRAAWTGHVGFPLFNARRG